MVSSAPKHSAALLVPAALLLSTIGTVGFGCSSRAAVESASPRPVAVVVPETANNPGSKDSVRQPDDLAIVGPANTTNDEDLDLVAFLRAQPELAAANLPESMLATIFAADARLRADLPTGSQIRYRNLNTRLPFQWRGNAGPAVRVDIVDAGGPKLTRYFYHRLDAGFSQPFSARIRPDRIYGVTRDFVVIMPSSSTPESTYETAALRPLFNRAFTISDANTLRHSLRLRKMNAGQRQLSGTRPEHKAAIAGDPANQTTYALWVRTLR